MYVQCSSDYDFYRDFGAGVLYIIYLMLKSSRSSMQNLAS